MVLAGDLLCSLAEREHFCATGALVFATRLHAQACKAEAQKARMQSSQVGNNAVDDGVYGFAMHNGQHVRVLHDVSSACSWSHENGTRQIVRLCASSSWRGQMQIPYPVKAHAGPPALLQKAGRSEFF
ncbi:hypothetical protein BBA71_04080 [Acetobacter pasteurianus]|nr:hypothetical protein BBA71_04080 [Acetobacter pasteurianus]